MLFSLLNPLLISLGKVGGTNRDSTKNRNKNDEDQADVGDDDDFFVFSPTWSSLD